MARSETSPLLHGVRRGIDSHVVDLDGPSGESKVFGASKKTRAWMLAGVTAVVGTVAVAGVGVEGTRSALGAAAGVGMADSMAWRPGSAFVSAPSAVPSLGNDKWAAYVQQGADYGNAEVAAIGEDERDPNTMLHQWDQVVKWGSGLNPNDNLGNHPGLYDSVDPTIPFESDVDKQSAHLTWDQAKKLGYIMTPESFKTAIKAHPTSFLVIHAVNGLGNRMRALAAGKCLARERNRKLIIVWERDDSLKAPVQSMMTPSFLRGSFILENLPYAFLAAEHEKLTKLGRGEAMDGPPPSFSLIHDATTDWGKQRVSIETAPDAWANWKGAAYIKSSHAELQLTPSEYNFVGSYMVYFEPSPKVSAMMKTVPLADKSDDQVVSMHIRAGEDAKLSKDLKLDGEAAAEVKLVDSYRQQCTVDSFVDVLTKRAPDAVSRGVSVFVAADKPEDVAALRARLPNNKVFALSRPDYCNYGYNRAREEECMVYAVADLFLLSRNPGPMLRSKFSSFSDFANYYRKRAGRLQGKGFLVNGCHDDGHGEDGVLTAAAEAALGMPETRGAETSSLGATKYSYEGKRVEKRAFSDVVKARFAMGVQGGGHYKLTRGGYVGGDASTRLSADAVSLCDEHADHALCAKRDMNQMEGFFREMRTVARDASALASLGLKADEGVSVRKAPFVVELNALLGPKPSAAAYPTPQSTASDPVFPEVRAMAATAEANGVDFSVVALYRDPVEAVARTASLSKPAAADAPSGAPGARGVLDRVIGSFSKQAEGYREMSAQLASVSRDFYQCHSMDDEAVGAASSGPASASALRPARALLATGSDRIGSGEVSADLGAGVAHDPLEPQVLAAYDSLGADAFYWFSALSRGLRAASSSDAFASTLSVAMRDRVELLKRVQADLGRTMNKVEMARYVGAENDAYAAYFAFRTGACR
jgi:hypothetical protein